MWAGLLQLKFLHNGALESFCMVGGGLGLLAEILVKGYSSARLKDTLVSIIQ